MTSGLLTKFSVAEIQDAIQWHIPSGYICLRNVSFGFFKHIEVDFIVESPAGYLTDFEIKRSKEDFVADFKKKHYHDDIRLKKLVYVLPEALAVEWLKDFCAQNYKTFRRSFDILFYGDVDGRCKILPAYERVKSSVIPWKAPYGNPTKYNISNYLSNDMIAEINKADVIFDYRRKLFMEEKVKLYRLALLKCGCKRV